MSDLDIDAKTPDSCECKDSKFIYTSAGHVVTGNMKIIPDSRIRKSNRKAMNRNWSNQKANPALKTKTGKNN